MSDLFSIAQHSLRANIETLSCGRFLTAGRNQFLTLWTRDFCHAVKGLMSIGEEEVVRNHLIYLLSHLRADGLVPRVIDNHLVQFRVAWQTLRKQVPFIPELSFKEPLKAQYQDEHGSNAFDSNLLLLLAALELPDDFWIQHEENLLKVFHWYDDKFKDGLLYQASFSDWQDTTNREGHTFLLNLFYFMVASRLKTKDLNFDQDLEAFKKKIKELFFSDGVFLSLNGQNVVSVEANLFALLDEAFLTFEEKKSLWEKLKAHPVIALDGTIGRCSYPDWPSKDLAWHIKFARLKRYHGSLSWSWLMGLGLKTALVMNDQQMIQKQLRHIEKILLRDGEVYEVYDPLKDFSPWGSWLIQSEHPFAWGAGYLCDALNFMAKKSSL